MRWPWKRRIKWTGDDFVTYVDVDVYESGLPERGILTVEARITEKQARDLQRRWILASWPAPDPSTRVVSRTEAEQAAHDAYVRVMAIAKEQAGTQTRWPGRLE